MAFADDIANQLGQNGLSVPTESIPTQDVFDAGVASLQGWLASLDDDTHSMFDELTADFPVKAGLADAAVNLAPGFSELFSTLDGASASLSISVIVQRLADASRAVAAALPVS